MRKFKRSLEFSLARILQIALSICQVLHKVAVCMAHSFERWDNSEDEEECIIPAVLCRQHVFPDSKLHKLVP